MRLRESFDGAIDRAVAKYLIVSRKLRLLVILFWVVALGFGIWLGPRLPSHTSLTFRAPGSYLSVIASDKVKEEFPERGMTDATLFLVASTRDESVIDDEVRKFTWNIYDWIVASLPAGGLQSFQSYYYFMNESLPELAEPFVSKDRIHTLINANVRNDVYNAPDWIPKLRDALKQFRPDPQRFSCELTGLKAVVLDMQEGEVNDLIRMNIIILPIAFLFFAFILRVFRFIIIPLINLPICIMVSFMLVYFVSLHLTVSGFTPTIMLALMLAFSIDYSLFMTTRYAEEIMLGRSVRVSVDRMVLTAGKTITTSNVTLVMSFILLSVVPVSLISSVAIGAAIALVLTLLVNLTLTPAVLLTFPCVFSNFYYLDNENLLRFLLFVLWPVKALVFCVRRVLSNRTPVGTSEVPTEETELLLGVGATIQEDVPKKKELKLRRPEWLRLARGSNADTEHIMIRRMKHSFWYWSAKLSTNHPYLVVIAVICLLLPCAIQIYRLKLTVNSELVLPPDCESWTALQDVEAVFGAGVSSPFYLLSVVERQPPGWVPLSGTEDIDVCGLDWGVFTTCGFIQSQRLISSIVDGTSLPASVAYGIMWAATEGLPGPINFSVADALVNDPTFPLYDQHIGRIYRQGFDTLVGDQNRSTLISITTPFPPFDDDAMTWIKDVRKIMDDFEKSPRTQYERVTTPYLFTYYLAGGGTATYDVAHFIYTLIPVLCVVTIVVVLVMISVIFRSITLAVRLVLTSSFSICVSFGFAVLAFQSDGTFYSFIRDVFPSLKTSNKIYFDLPFMGVSILTALGLDYEIFVCSRIVEFRKEGFTDRAAILRGVFMTGRVITGGGACMVLAFLGLLLSGAFALKQYGLLLSFSVLLDTFVVRTMLVPSVMTMMKKYNWWPGEMPPGTKDEFDFTDALARVAEGKSEVTIEDLTDAAGDGRTDGWNVVVEPDDQAIVVSV